MLNSIKGLALTLVTTLQGLRKPVTHQYPTVPTPVQDRFMGFPALTWDPEVGEPFCTACMVCIRNCPTQCMAAAMKDNPLHAEGKSSRRKIVDQFEINLNRCILCGICVEVCNFDAIVMSHEHEMSGYQRNSSRVDLPALLAVGKAFQAETGWQPAAKAKPAAKPQPQPAAVSAQGEAKG
jgi:NADH-quinone oxidoreductase subunit I